MVQLFDGEPPCVVSHHVPQTQQVVMCELFQELSYSASTSGHFQCLCMRVYNILCHVAPVQPAWYLLSPGRGPDLLVLQAQVLAQLQDCLLA